MVNKAFISTTLSVVCSAAICCLPMFAKEPMSKAKSDAAFLSMAAQADMTAAHLGKMAQDRGAENPVKDFGKTLVTDHTDDYHQLTELSNKIGEAIPKAIDKSNDHEIATLNRAHGKTFDREFLARETSEHEKLLKAFKEEAKNGKNPEVRAYANKALPVLERHMHEAEDLVKGHKA